MQSFEQSKNPPWRPRKFKTPEQLWTACCEYFKWCDENPLWETDFRGKDVQLVKLPHPRAYTQAGLKNFLGVSDEYWREIRKRANKKNEVAFWGVITRVDEIINTQKYEYAAAGFFNANLIARDLGLTDKQDTNITVTEMPTVNIKFRGKDDE